MTQQAPNDPLIGTTVSQFEIVAKLGGGGMGVVYKARDLKLGRLVALKFLPPQWSHDEAAKQRFIREAQAASATEHRNICTIHDIAETSDGRLFIVMACYEGETLKQRLARGALPIADAMQIGLEIAEGLAKAHAQGVVHRDIKPGNIIVTDEGVKIVDFGLAKFADALQLTVPGTTIGTVAYMSPEQARGEEADAQSDVWAWGIVMYQMLTGAPPFRGGYPEATFHAIKYEPLPPMRAARPEIPDALEQIVLPALEKDRAQRYQSAREPARALRLLQGLTLPLDLRTQGVSVPSAARGRDAPPARRRGVPLRALAAVVIAAVVGGGWWLWAGRPVTRVPIAVVPMANHTGVPDLDRYRLALTATLIEELSGSPSLRVVPYLRLLELIRPFMSRGDVSSSDAVQAVSGRAGAQFLVIPTLVYHDREATWTLQVQVRNTQTGTAVSAYETPPITSSLSEQTAFQLTGAAAEQVQQYFRARGRGRWFAAAPEIRATGDRSAARSYEAGLNAYEALEFQRAAEAFGQAVAADPQHGLAAAWQSRALTVLGRKGDALAAGRRARELAGKTLSGYDAMLAEAIAAEAADDAGAEAAYRRLVTAWPDDPAALTELADYLKRRQDRNPQAIDAYHALLQLDPAYVRVHVDLCQLYTRIDDFPLANQEGAAAIKGATAIGNAGIEAQALLCLSEAERRSRRNFAEARRLAADARRLFETLDQPYNLARAIFYQASMEFSDRQFGAAAERFAEAAERLHETGNQTLEATALMNRGIANYYTGKPTDTLKLFARSEAAFAAIGDERRAAEMEVSLGGLQVDYGIDLPQALRRLRNARTNLERLGHIDFQLGAMQFEAAAAHHAGRLSEARQLLRAALAQARERRLSVRIAGLTTALAQVEIDDGNYEEALTLLQQGEAAASPEFALLEGVARTQVGDIEGGERALARAASALEGSTDLTLRPALDAALGALAIERGRPKDAIARFDAAIAGWHDPLVPSAVVDARCARGEAEAALGRVAAARQDFAAGQAAAERLTHYRLMARCRVGQASLDVTVHRYAAAVDTLAAIPMSDAEQSLGRPLRVSVEYWRARALAGAGDPSAAARFTATGRMLAALQESLPEDYRARFAARPLVREIAAAATSGAAGAK